jgi:iron complex outermembrane recepter protein
MPGAIRFRSFSIFCLWLLLSIASRTADAQIRFDLPSQPLAKALTAVGSLSNLNIYFEAPIVDGIQAPPLRAELSADAAVARLLAGTRLHAVRVDDNTIRVESTPEGKRASAPSSNTGAVYTPGSVHLAYAGADVRETVTDQPDNTSVTNPGELTLADRRRHQGEIAEVVVTAEKREESAQDVPISIVAVGSDELQQRNITTIDDLVFAVPGLSIQSDGSTTRRIMLRGISNTLGNSSSSLIGLYLDEASVTAGLSSQLDLRTYDLERVEVLRGPQGTLYGDGSVGGTIRFITRDPDLKHFGFNADVAALFTENGAPSQRIDEVINVPLIDDVLGVRISGSFDHEGGWIDQPAADRSNINEQNLADVRIKTLWKPTDEFRVNATVNIHRNNGGFNSGEDANGNYTQTFNLTTTPQSKDYFDIYNVTMTYDLPVAKLLSTTSYIKQRQEVNDTGISFQITDPGTPQLQLYESYFSRNETLSEELRLSSVGKGPAQWTVGGFFRRADFSVDNPLAYVDFAGPPGTPLPPNSPSQTSSQSKSWAAFGDFNYMLAERLTLGAGVRYFHDDQTLTPPFQTGAFHATSPRAYLGFKLSDEVNTYASASKGFRSGGFNAVDQPSYGPESVWTYELGVKSTLLDRHLILDADIFYSNYTNYQVAGLLPPPSPPLDIYSNAGKATIKGLEWDIAWRLLDQWTLSLGGDYLNTKFTEINVTDTSYVVGDPLDFFPKYSITASAQRDFEVQGKSGFVRLDYNRQGRETFRDRNVAGPTPWYFGQSDIINMMNFNATLHWSDSLQLSFFAQNLLNNRGLTSPFSVNTETDAEIRSRPRTYGVSFGVKLN